MSSYRPHSPTFGSHSPYNPVNQQPVTSDYVIQDKPLPRISKTSTEKMALPNEHELEPLSEVASNAQQKEPDRTEEVEDSPYKFLSRKERYRVLFHALRFLLTTVIIAILLSIPLFILHDTAYIDDTADDNIQRKNLVYWFFTWFLVTWLVACFFNLVGLILPYLFWIIAKFINPAHRRYWRILRPLRFGITLLGGVLGFIIAFAILIINNSYLAINLHSDLDAYALYIDVLNIVYDIELYILTWVLMYLFTKVIIIYISVHYHYRSDSIRIEKSKNMLAALGALYETSIYLDPVYSKKFETEDLIIRNASLSGGGKRKDAAKFFQKIGGVGTKALSVFGNVINSEGKSHWFKATSTYATIEQAIESPKSAAALAQRIWTSLASEGKDVLTADDIAEAMGPFRKEEAQQIFEVVDENENGDIQLEEMIQTVVEASRTRTSIYQGMHDINHAINTFEWVLLSIIAILIIFLILVNYFQPLAELKQMVGLSALGLSFALGRTVHDFVGGATFVFFKHAFDVGDRVDLFNVAENNWCSVVVKQINLLYCIFERCDDGKSVQFPTSSLNIKRIENLNRSGLNREKVTLYVDINTSFKDIEYLRFELKSFVGLRENARDYKPDLSLRVKSVHELNKLELAVVFTHKSNWSNEALRSARSSKFMCALLAALRRVPIDRPSASPPKLGSQDKPTYMVMVTDAEAAEKRAADDVKGKKKRWDWEDELEEDNSEEAIGEGLAQKKKEEKEAKAKEEETKAKEAIGAIPPTLAAQRERPRENAGDSSAAASGNDASFRRLVSNAGAEEFVQQHGLGGRRRRVDIGGRNTSISGPFYNAMYGR